MRRYIDQRSLDHPVTRLAEEYGWQLDREYGGPGRCIYSGPKGQKVAACLTEILGASLAIYLSGGARR